MPLLLQCRARAVFSLAVAAVVVLMLSGSAAASEQLAHGVVRRASSLPYMTKAPIQIVQAEKAALLALKAALNNHPAFNGDFTPTAYVWTNGAWTNGSIAGIPAALVDPCFLGWAFIGCNLNGRVVQISLPGYDLSSIDPSWQAGGAHPLTGRIPWGRMAALAELEFFDVSFQNIGGTLQGIGHFASLASLSLAANKFGGIVPSEIGRNRALSTLRLDGNGFSGALPWVLGSLINLTRLTIADNKLSGPFPAQLAQLRHLNTLDISGNKFRSSVPAVWDRLPHLQRLFLSNNHFYGPLPSNLWAPRTLIGIAVEGNYFSGKLLGPPRGSRAQFRYGLNCLKGAAGQRAANVCARFYQCLSKPKLPGCPAVLG